MRRLVLVITAIVLAAPFTGCDQPKPKDDPAAKPDPAFKSQPFLQSSQDAWLETGPLSGEVGFDADKGDVQGPLTLGLLLNRSVAGLSVKADSKIQTLKDFVEYAKANPGALTVGNPGPGSPWQLVYAAFAHQYNLKTTQVSFDGSAPSRTALVGGHIGAVSTGLDEVLQFYQTKQIRILAATSPERNSFFPEVPTVAEAGYPVGNPIFDWRGLATAKGTPPEILKILRDGFRKAVQDPEYIALMDKMALPRAYMEYDKFGDFLANMEKSLEPTLGLVGLLKK